MNAQSKLKADRQAYLAEAASWAEDRQQRQAQSLRLAWRVAAVLGLVAVLEAVALAALAPLKTVVPYTITVDRRSGYVETARGVRLGALSEREAVTEAFLAQYVMARETFDAADLNENYQKVAAWSQGRARATYLRAYDRNNTQSVLRRVPATTVVSVRIKSISHLNKTTALVRFDTQRLDAGAAEPSPGPAWTAVVTYRYLDAPLRMEDRFINPLGFQVTDYRRDAEAGGDAPYVQGSHP
jgi:type IV secretion system protein VirB8